MLLYSLLRLLLDIVPRERIVRHTNNARKPIKAVSNSDVEGLSKDAVALLRVRDDLGVTARNVQHNRVCRVRDVPPHLDVCHAVVHPNERDTVQLRQSTGDKRADLEGGTHAWA